MAQIETSTLRIGSNDLILQDAEAREDLETVKDGLSSVENNILTNNIRQALLQIAEKVAYIDEDGQDYYDDLYDALYPPAPPADLVSISAVYTQSGTVYDTDTLDSLKSDLVVTAHMSDSTTQTVTAYTLSGTLTVGTSTITVTYGGKTTTFNVTVTEKQTIHITYTQGSIGAGNTDANRVSGVITSDIHFDDGENMVISVESGYSVFPFGYIPNADPNSAGTKVSSPNNVLNAYVVSDSSYVVPGLIDMNGTLYANTKSLNSKGDAGWMTGTVTYTFTKTGQYGYTFTGLGFLVKKNDNANITPSDIEPLITVEA